MEQEASLVDVVMEVVTGYDMDNMTNSTAAPLPEDRADMSWDDATWIMTASFIIFTMQSGFGLLESGCVSLKNEVNIMVKNAVDVILGGLSYWVFGYGLSFGTAYSNIFFAAGDFAVSAPEQDMGPLFATYIFQLSFATTATTIVSGAIAERFNFMAYCMFSFINTVVYCIPAGWLWGEHGFLYKMGAIDIAGSAGVHLVGGVSGLVACIMVGPRLGRYDHGHEPFPMGSPTNAMLGMFMLWWGWLGFNCGSTFGVRGHKWKYAARSAVTTINASLGGGLFGCAFSLITTKKLMIGDLINSVLGGLVAVTAGCALYHTWEAVVVGIVGGMLAVVTMPLVDRLKIDDPVGAVSVHGVGGLWGVLAIGLFVDADSLEKITNGRAGLFKGGGWHLLGVQTLCCVCIIIWSAVVTFILLFLINKVKPIRMSAHEELLGADLVEHGIRHQGLGLSRTVSALRRHSQIDPKLVTELPPEVGSNLGHMSMLKKLRQRLSQSQRSVVEVTPITPAPRSAYGARDSSAGLPTKELINETSPKASKERPKKSSAVAWINFDEHLDGMQP
ncbi:putative ammonium transporter 3 isoform X2 [Amphibalanus amphitrite]|uniref:putative ammonium transporter 3 isoform X2 n=1 Tax=Amphibalanus amphitrite TaxID=1232801 RepID=UPI001C8FEB57|nr:putative ammonium transporter 3 [Amphibalanus amphitrite]XP_043205064.1 putative ammonium transporter 3 isoform X2 [Amphibalanus amphitrite]